MPKHNGMPNPASSPQPYVLPHATPWSLRAWPPLLWQAGASVPVRFHHLNTLVMIDDRSTGPAAGQTVWAASAERGDAGVAWDWIQITRGVVAMADPLAVVTNLRLVGRAGEALAPMEVACFLNELVRGLPWQEEVRRALREH